MKVKQWFLKKFEEWKTHIEIERRDAYIKRTVPWNCYTCELLGICRDEDNGWKCRHGCMILNAERRRKDKE